MPFVCILGEVIISYIFCFIFQDLLTFRTSLSFSDSLDLIQSFGHLKSEGFLKYSVKISLKATWEEPQLLPKLSHDFVWMNASNQYFYG